MNIAWIYILLCSGGMLVVSIRASSSPISNETETKNANEESLETLSTIEDERRREREEENEEEEEEEEKKNNNELPILPPIILIDFVNGTNNSSLEDKSKRTINDNLGYGFRSNNFFERNKKYYFPSGNSGTTVSIEESISPFLPRTIIEKVNHPLFDKLSFLRGNYEENFNDAYTYRGFDTNDNEQRIIDSGFGQRTKLTKVNHHPSLSYLSSPPPPLFSSYTTTTTTLRPKSINSNYSPFKSSVGNGANTFVNRFYSNGYGSYTTTPKPVYDINSGNIFGSSFSAITGISRIQGTSNQAHRTNDHSSNPSYSGYSSTPATLAYHSIRTSYIPSGSFKSTSFADNANYLNLGSGIKPIVEKEDNANVVKTTFRESKTITDLPRYSYENGIKYEHKIVWKYPNGEISEFGPSSSSTNYNVIYNSRPSNDSNLKNERNNRERINSNSNSKIYPTDASNIYDQRPATFPSNSFIDSSELTKSTRLSSALASSSANINGNVANNSLRKFHYENLDETRNPNYYFQRIENIKDNKKSTESIKLTNSPYPISSPEAEYPSNVVVVPPPSRVTPNRNLEIKDDRGATAFAYSRTSRIPTRQEENVESYYSNNGGISNELLSRYTPRVQEYLKKALGGGGGGERGGDKFDTVTNVDYSTLLDYNPSISRYIENSSSILNARPTFVQAGNSVIPVIILRVDGVAPIEPKLTPKVNLKSLLQKYLLGYARTINELRGEEQRGKGGQLEREPISSSIENRPSSIYEYYSNIRNNEEKITTEDSFNESNQFGDTLRLSRPVNGNEYYPRGEYSQLDTDTRYRRIHSTDINEKTETNRSHGKTKIKNVQIIDDPRFTTYTSSND